MRSYKITISLITLCAVLLSGCGAQTENPPAASETAASSAAEAAAVPEEKVFVPDKTHVKLIGRTAIDNDILWLANTDSGCEFTFSGLSASLTVIGDNVASSSSGEGNYARFAVYLNGERIIDDLVKEPEKNYEIFSSETESENTVTVIKLSEAGNSTLGIKDIRVVSAGDISPTPEKPLKIEFIGDSITCGYGVDDEVKEHHFSTATEDGAKTYAYKTAQKLGADYSMVCYSGHGIISGYTSNGRKSPNQLVPKFYEMTAHTSGNYNGFSMSKTDWDFDVFRPDAVVINLGTNDASYCKNNEEYRAEFRDRYVDFLKQIRSHNPDAYILCTLGIMGNDLYTEIEEAVSLYKEETGDERVSAMMFENQSMDDGIAADWHPSEKTHEKAAEKLAAELKSILDLDP